MTRAVFALAPYVADRVTGVVEATLCAVTLNERVVCPAGIVTVAGAGRSAGFELVSAMSAPSGGAGLSSVTSTGIDTPPGNADGLTTNDEITDGATLRGAVSVSPSNVAEIVVVPVVEPVVTPIGNNHRVAELIPPTPVG